MFNNPPNKLIVQGAQPSGLVVVNSGFWPDIKVDDFRDAQRLDGTVTNPRLQNALINAAASANQELSAYRQQQIALGYSKLIDVPSETIGGVSVMVHRYLHAVYTLAKAKLVEQYIDFDATNQDGEKEGLDKQVVILMREYTNAISDIAGRSRMTVELI